MPDPVEAVRPEHVPALVRALALEHVPVVRPVRAPRQPVKRLPVRRVPHREDAEAVSSSIPRRRKAQ